jgi:hypothetical protein
VPASLGPGLRTASGTNGDATELSFACHPVNSQEESPPSQKTQLALAIAQGTPVTKWAKKNGVNRRTAFRWAKEPRVRKAVESYRRRILDRAVGRMTYGVTWATDEIFKLARSATSESVKLSACRAVVSDMMAVSKFGVLEDRVSQMEGKIDARTGSTTRAN